MNDIVRTKRLRAWLGWLAIALPWVVVLLQLCNDTFKWPASISATWYTNACTPFMIILGAAAILLMNYHGYDLMDDILNTTAGIFALGICLFPCYSSLFEKVGTFQVDVNISSIIHNVSAIIFFVILAYISFFQFTKSNGNPDKRKKIRNIIFRVCGIGMLASFAILLLPNFYIQVWLTEAFALAFFGISWLTKANKYKWLAADPKKK